MLQAAIGEPEVVDVQEYHHQVVAPPCRTRDTLLGLEDALRGLLEDLTVAPLCLLPHLRQRLPLGDVRHEARDDGLPALR